MQSSPRSLVFSGRLASLMSDFDEAPAFCYAAFGVYLRSDVPVPGLTESANPGLPEVLLSMGGEVVGLDPAQFTNNWYESHYKVASGEPFLSIRASIPMDGRHPSYWMKYADGTNVYFGEDLTRIVVNWSPESCIEDAATYLLGPAMAVFCQLRGTTCLHGSAVIVDDVAIALLGPQGAGKSTTAAAFARAGYSVLADDLILLVESANGFLVEPTYPVVRLWPSAVGHLFGDEEALPRLIPNWEKPGLNLSDGAYRFQWEPRPLAAIYMFGDRSTDDSAPFLRSFSGAEALLKLISNSWGHYADKPGILASQLHVLTRVSRTVPIRWLFAHQDAARLPQLCELLVQDVRRNREPASRGEGGIPGQAAACGNPDREGLAERLRK